MPVNGGYDYSNKGTKRRLELEQKRKQKWEAMKAATRAARTTTRGEG